MIRNAGDVGPSVPRKCCKRRRFFIRPIIELAEPVSIDNYVVTPEVVASADDPEQMALILLIYGTVVVRSGMPVG